MRNLEYSSWKIILLTIIFTQFFACKEAFDPSLDTPSSDFLVVEGFINTAGSTTIKLTRTQKLAAASVIKNELKANVQIENDNNFIARLSDNGEGIYRLAAQNLPADRKYRLRIKTADGKEYLSEFTPAKTTPKLTLTWEQSSDGVRIFASSVDPSNQTLYYKYDFEETWSMQSNHISLFVARTNPAPANVTVGRRSIPDQIDALICWRTDLSDNIITISTKNLSSDVIDKYPVMFIPNGSDKLGLKYSILVRQYALTTEAYDFFEQMKKNTELLGSVFDPLPSTLRGNIKCISDPSEPVVGNIIAASGSEQRIFIERSEVGYWQVAIPCGVEYILNNLPNFNQYLRDDKYLIIDAHYDEKASTTPPILGYYISNPLCLDCRKRGGNNTKPDFW